MVYVPGDEKFDYTTVDGSQINGAMLQKRTQDPLIAALAGLFLQETYLTLSNTYAPSGANLVTLQSLADVGLQVPYDVMIRDTLGGYVPATNANAVTIPKTGFYMVTAAITYDNVAGDGFARIKRNGNRVGPTGMVHQVAIQGINTAQTTAFILCSTGDVITAAGATSGGSVMLGAGSGHMMNRSETNLVVAYLGS